MTASPDRRLPAPLARARRVVVRLCVATVAAIASVETALLVVRPENGLPAVIDLLSPHLALAGLALVPFCLLRRSRTTAVAIALLIAASAFRFGGNWVSLPVASAAGGGTDRIEVATWNLEVFSRPGSATAGLLRNATADIVALQEHQPVAAEAIDHDPVLRERYPYRILNPRSDVLGLGILSRFPMAEDTFDLGPAVQTARALLPGRQIAVVNAHPLHGTIATTGGLPVGFDVTQRNRDLDTIRGLVDRIGSDGTPLILLGDLNTADSEPAFARFVSGGLRDVHAEVGFGPGWTWRPSRLEFLGFGLVRIDHVVVTPTIQPLSIGESCPPVGDHCLVHAALAVPVIAQAAAAGK